VSGVTSSPDATIIVAVVVVLGHLANIWVQRRVHRDNRDDHAQTAAKVDELLVQAATLGADVRDVKADVRDVKSTLRDHGHRIDDLEHQEDHR
jgi:hypothetical protein